MDLSIVFVIIIIGGWFFSKLFLKIKLPSIVGMLFCGLLISFFLKNYLPQTLWDISPLIKSTALIVILLRAGLGLNKNLLKKTGKIAILMSIIPCLLEGVSLTILIHLILGYEIINSALPAFMIAAVSPAVIIPSMLELKEKGYGQHKEVPTIVLAASSIDDVFAITIFGIFLNISMTSSFTFSKMHIFKELLSIPYSIISGVIIGYLTGLFLVHVFKNFKIRATEKTILLITISTLIVYIGNLIQSATLLGAMTISYVLFEKSNTFAKEISLKLAKIWIPAEIFLFVLVGSSVDIKVIGKIGFKGLLIISLGLIFRSIGVLLATKSSQLNFKERLFCVISFIPKATVQAALGMIPLQLGIIHGEEILAFAVIAILLTAPLGLILMNFFSKKLLN